MSKIKNLWQSKNFRLSVCILSSLILFLIVFQLGRFVGFHQARFSYRMGDNYYQAFEGGRRGAMMKGPANFFGDDLPGGHGAVGKIVKITLPTIVISTPDNLEKTILLKNNTLIKRFRGSATSTDLKIDDMVIVIGAPNEGSQIEAKLIRVLPASPLSATSTSSR